MIPWSNPQAAYLTHQKDIDAAIARVLKSGSYIMGKEVEQFEESFAEYLNIEHAIGVASGTDALQLALKACDIGPGDEVITIAHTAIATVSAIEACGATPVFVDIDIKRYTIDPNLIEQAITANTKAIIPVHLYGQPADLKPILDIAKPRNIRVIEDCAQSIGARYHDQHTGTWGDAATFSFYPTKNLGCLGDAGMVVTRDEQLNQRIRALRQYGWDAKRQSHMQGLNSRMDEIQAAILRVKLANLDQSIHMRQGIAKRYAKLLADTSLTLPQEFSNAVSSFHLMVISSEQRDALKEYLFKQSIMTAIHYDTPIHLQPAYHKRIEGSQSLKNTEIAAKQVLSLPMFPELDDKSIQNICQHIINSGLCTNLSAVSTKESLS